MLSEIEPTGSGTEKLVKAACSHVWIHVCAYMCVYMLCGICCAVLCISSHPKSSARFSVFDLKLKNTVMGEDSCGVSSWGQAGEFGYPDS